RGHGQSARDRSPGQDPFESTGSAATWSECAREELRWCGAQYSTTDYACSLKQCRACPRPRWASGSRTAHATRSRRKTGSPIFLSIFSLKGQNDAPPLVLLRRSTQSVACSTLLPAKNTPATTPEYLLNTCPSLLISCSMFFSVPVLPKKISSGNARSFVKRSLRSRIPRTT